jgi:hypothetical protein
VDGVEQLCPSALNPPEKLRKFNDHAADALRDGVMSVPKTPVNREQPGTMQELKTRSLRAQAEREQDEQDPVAEYL